MHYVHKKYMQYLIYQQLKTVCEIPVELEETDFSQEYIDKTIEEFSTIDFSILTNCSVDSNECKNSVFDMDPFTLSSDMLY